MSLLWEKTTICAHLLDCLRQRGGTVTEFELIRYLDSHRCFAAFAQEPANLQLFRKHFITRHCLYCLQEEVDASWRLEIGMLEIVLRQRDAFAADGTEVAAQGIALREYYRDLTHLETTDAASVDTLLQDFWRRFAAAEQSTEAMAVLELDSGATWADIQLAYRRKARRAHPDQGGTAAEFAALREAYEILQRHFDKSR